MPCECDKRPLVLPIVFERILYDAAYAGDPTGVCSLLEHGTDLRDSAGPCGYASHAACSLARQDIVTPRVYAAAQSATPRFIADIPDHSTLEHIR